MSAAAPRPQHAPYAGRHRAFSIAMAPIDAADWLEIDERRESELGLKREILRREKGEAFQAEAGTEAAQDETRALIVAHLSDRGITARSDPAVPALMDAAAMVQDDLVLMRAGPAGYRLAAGAVCFPSSWSLQEKFGQPMDVIHTSVPGWDRMAPRVSRIFTTLSEETIVWRLNWSIQKGQSLRLPRPKGAPDHVPASSPSAADPRLDAGPTLDADWSVRVERQTLRRLSTGDLLFTIKVLVDPLATLAAHPDGARYAGALADQLADLTEPELSYKGLLATRDRLCERLRTLGQSDDTPLPTERGAP